MSINEVIPAPAIKVMSLAEVAQAAGVSINTLRRELKRGTGPEVTLLSPRRMGVRVDSFHRWLDSRTGQ
jgi:hypothetical protein